MRARSHCFITMALCIPACVGGTAWSAGYDINESVSHPFLKHPLPEGCHAQQRRVQALDSDAPELHHKKLPGLQTKIDVLCVGDGIVIDREIRTSGGDVLIYASNVKIRSSIDTRPYFARRVEFFFEHRADVPGAPRRSSSGLDEHFGDGSSFGRVTQRWWLSARDFYLRAPNKMDADGVAYAPELLGGMTPIYIAEVGAKPRPAIAPPAKLYDEQTLRSGDITIIAGDLEFGDLPAGEPEPSPLACASSNPAGKYLLNVSGARGARGGWQNVIVLTPPNTRNVGPGSGGNAGNVSIHLLSEPMQQLLADIAKHASVRGGPSGVTEQVLIESGRINPNKTPSVCQFRLGTPHPPAAPGLDGRVSVDTITSIGAAVLASQYVFERDAGYLYDIPELANRASVQRTINARSYQGFLQARLGRLTLGAQRRVADDLIAAMYASVPGKTLNRACAFAIEATSACGKAGANVAEDTEYVPTLFQIEAKALNPLVMDPELVVAFQSLSLHRSVGDDAATKVRNYLISRGGLLNSPTGNFQDSSENQRLFEMLARAEENDLQLQKAVKDLHLEVHRFRVLVERNILETRLQALKAQLGAAAGSGFADLIKLAGDVGEKADKADSAYKKLKEKLGVGDDIATAIAGIGFLGKTGALVGAIGKLSQLSGSDNAALRRQAHELEKELREFLKASQLEREALLSEGVGIVLELLDARRRGAIESNLRSVSFEYLLRRVLILYQRDPAAGSVALLQQLNQLRSYADDDVVRFAPAGDLRQTCEQFAVNRGGYVVRDNCIYWKASGERREVLGDVGVRGAPNLASVPLIVIAPNYEGSQGLALFGFKPTGIRDIK